MQYIKPQWSYDTDYRQKSTISGSRADLRLPGACNGILCFSRAGLTQHNTIRPNIATVAHLVVDGAVFQDLEVVVDFPVSGEDNLAGIQTQAEKNGKARLK